MRRNEIQVKLTLMETQQILHLIEYHESRGEYNGNKKQYCNRAESIKDKLTLALVLR